jgi:hypothetical protein
LRLRDFLVGTVLRPLTLAAWCLVLWGTLIGVLFLGKVVTAGPSAAWASLYPDVEAGFWAWLNLVCLALAVFTWVVAAVLAWLHRRSSAADA